MSFLRHPIYGLLTLGSCAWLSVANVRGWSLAYSANPANWVSSGKTSGSQGFGHGFSHSFGSMGHK